MAQSDQVGPAALHDALKLLGAVGAAAVGALFVIAGAANIGFCDAFGIQDLGVVGIDKSAVIDHTIVFGVVLLVIFGGLFAFAVGVAAAARRDVAPFKQRGTWGTLAQLVLVLAVLVGCGIVFVQATRANLKLAAGGMALMAAAYATVAHARRVSASVATHPVRWVAGAIASTTLLAFAAFFQGAAWGAEVRALDRTKAPLLGHVLIVQWPRGAVLDERADLCTSDILLGRAGGTYVLFNVRTRLVHEVPANRPLTRIALRAVTRNDCPPAESRVQRVPIRHPLYSRVQVKRSGCPGPASPASAR